MIVLLCFVAYLALVLLLALWRGRQDAAKKHHRSHKASGGSSRG